MKRIEDISYIKLIDLRHYGTVIRMYIIGRQRHHERYKNGEWVQTSLMIDYFNPDGEHYDDYDDITEEEVNKLISSELYINREDLDKYESEACIKILDHMFLLSDQIEVPKDIETIKSFDHTKKND